MANIMIIRVFYTRRSDMADPTQVDATDPA
jgi:hypothetical protein